LLEQRVRHVRASTAAPVARDGGPFRPHLYEADGREDSGHAGRVLVTDDRPATITATAASHDVTVQHQRPAVSLRSDPMLWSFVKV